jgi:hypothetical protein
VKKRRAAEKYGQQFGNASESLEAIMKNIVKNEGTFVPELHYTVKGELYKAFRAAGREEDYRTQADIAKTIAAVVRARHQIAPPKAARGPLKTYTIEASPESWPEPPKKDEEDGRAEVRESTS